MPEPELTSDERAAIEAIDREFTAAMRDHAKSEAEGADEVKLALGKQRVAKAAIRYAQVTNMSWFDDVFKPKP